MYYLKYNEKGFQTESVFNSEISQENMLEEGWKIAPDSYTGTGFSKLINDEIILLSSEEEIRQAILEATFENRMNNLRMRRNQLLQQSDWTQTTDSPLSENEKNSWKAYRKALRDIPETISGNQDPNEIEFPSTPN